MSKGTYGPERAKVVIVGDALSKWEYDNDVVLHFKTRNILFDFLEEAGFDSRDVLYVPCFSGAKLSGLKLDGSTLHEDAQEWLIPIVKKHPRKIVIGLGNNAVCALGVTDKPEGVNGLRSRRLSSPFLPGVEIAAALHPKLVMDKPDENGDDFFSDLSYARRIANGDFEDQAPIYIIDLLKPDDVWQIHDSAKLLKGTKRLSYDIETSGLDVRQDLVTTMAFANGTRIPQGWNAWFWAGFDKLQPLFEDHVLDQFGQSFADFFNEVPKHYDILTGHNSIQFDDDMLEANIGRPIFKCNKDTRLDKYVVQKYGNHGLKENVTRYLGYADYDKAIDDHVREIAKRRSKVIYEFDEVMEDMPEPDGEGNTHRRTRQLVRNPYFDEEVFVCEWGGHPPEFEQHKTRGRKFKWPEKLDKKFAAWAMVPLEDIRLYNSYDALYSWFLGEEFDEIIGSDERLQLSSYWRHRFAKYLIKATNRGMLMDVQKNREFSELYGQIIENADREIAQEVVKIAPELQDFNPNSAQQLRKVLYGEPVKVPHIDHKSLYDYFDFKSVNQSLDDFHERFYRGYGEIKDLVANKEYDYDVTVESIQRAFKKYMGGIGNRMAFETPTRTNRDPNKVYVGIVAKPVYANGIYQPDPKAFTKGGEPSTAAQVLKNLYSQRQERILQLILMRSKAAKLKGTFIDGIYKKIDAFNVLHGEYNPTGARTGRLSSRNPNCQNFTPYLRGQLVARPGYRILTWDLSQAEVRVVAALSGDEELMKAVYSEDFHSTTAMMVFGLESIAEVTKAQRSFCKVLNFMVIYGGSAYALAMMLNISVEQAEDLLSRYFERFPKLCAGLEDFKKQAATQFYVETVFGTRISTRNILSTDHKVRGHTERLAMNSPVQGSSGELTLYFIDEIMRIWNDAHEPHEHIHLINTTHDSASFEVPEHLLWNVAGKNKKDEDIEIACGPVVDLCREVIEQTTVPFPPLDTVRFKCDIEITDQWYGEPDAMKALEAAYGTEKQELPWHLILGASDEKEEKEELEEIQELEEAYYADRAA